MRHPKLIRREAEAIEGVMDIELSKLPRSILEALKNAGIYTIEQLQYLSEDELYRVMRDNGLGTVAVDKVLEFTKGSKGVTMYDPNYNG